MNAPQTNSEKNRKVAAILALLGSLQPTPVPLAGIHKFYLGQYGWGIFYVLLGATQVPRIACAAEGVWYLAAPWLTGLWLRWRATSTPGMAMVSTVSSSGPTLGETVTAVATSLREIERLRQEGLLSDYEFEQKRRSLLEHVP